jgi:hypothetical protein
MMEHPHVAVLADQLDRSLDITVWPSQATPSAPLTPVLQSTPG